MAMLRARYGAKDNSHTLLWQSDPAIKLPIALLGLTDRPQGYEQPGEVWWPSVGCAPLGEYWALWWTLPDSSAKRGGMVRSEVALWPMAEIGALPDLSGVLQELSGEPFPAASSERLSSFAEAVLNPIVNTSVVLGLDDWPEFLAGLWPRLSPSLRCQFSARVALTPPQSGESVAEPWVYGAPSGRRLQWPGRQRVEADTLFASRAARWLAGHQDALLEEVLAAYDSDCPDLAALRRAGRAADGLERLRNDSSAADAAQAIALLRTLVTLPETKATQQLQQEAIAGIASNLSAADYPTVKSLANVPLLADDARPLLRSMVEWVENQVLTLALPDAGDLLSRATKSELQSWWRQGVCEALRLGFSQLSGDWPRQTLCWMGLNLAHPVLNELLPGDPDAETGLLGAATRLALPDGELQACQAQCGRRNWSRLHAHILHNSVPPAQQLPSQLAFPGTVEAGLAYLVEKLPGDIVLAQTLATPEPPLLPLAAQRTCQQPDLLAELNPGEAHWRTLWAAHIQVGGTHWPPGANQAQLASQLVDAVLDGAKADSLVMALADELADTVVTHPQRARIWPMLGHGAAAHLLVACARRFIQHLQSPIESEPEQPFSQAILAQTQSGPRSAVLIATVVNWSVCADEQTVCRWLEQSASAGWTQTTAEKLGQATLRRGWSWLTATMYSQCRRGNRAMAFGVQFCMALLPMWDRLVFACSYAPSPSKAIDQNVLVRRVAELGEELAPHEALYYWERAGGKRKDINAGARPSEQWQDMARRANNGGIKEYGLLGLVNELLHSFSRNSKLQELQEILQRQNL